MEFPEVQAKTLRQRLAVAILKILGWRVVHLPAPKGFERKHVVIGYPHTSNWDFFAAMLWIAATNLPVRWVGKAELFNGFMGIIMRALGGVALNRTASKNFVDSVVDAFARTPEMVLLIAPEGTRKRAEYWRTGFYYIALEAGLPVGLAILNYKDKVMGVGAYLVPTGNIEKDFEFLADFYKDKPGHDPSKQSPVRVKPKNG